MGHDMSKLPDHTQGNRATGVMAQFDGNISRNYEGVKNARLTDEIQVGKDDQCGYATPVCPEDYDAP